MNIGQLIASMGVDTAGLIQARREMDRFEADMKRKVNSINARMQTMGKAAQRAGRRMSMYLTLPLTLAGGAAFKLYKDFDSSMTKIVSLVGVAQSTVDGWRKDLLKMAPELGKAPAELADAMFFVTSAGFRGAAALDILEQSAKASAAGLGETKVVADLATSAINAYGEANLSAGQAMDILVATVREGKAEAPALAASLGMVLPVASAMGVTFDQVGAAVAAMTRTGTSAQTAAMQLRQILASMLKPTNQAKEALEGMGTSATEMRKILREKGLLAALTKLNDLQAEYGEETLATVFPNIRALAGVLDIMGSNAESNIAIFESLSDATGAADYAFQKVTETAEFRWNRAVAAGKTALTAFGKVLSESLIPLLEGLAERLQNLTKWFQSLDDRQRKVMITITAIVAAAGPLLTIFGFLASSIVPGLIKVVYGAVKAFNVLKLAMLSNPIGIVLTAIAAATAAFVILKRRLDDTTEAQKALNDVNETATRSIAKQKSQVDQLFRIAQSEAATLEQRQAAIDELNRISPEYFGNLTTETVLTDEATKSKTAYINELIREAKVLAVRDKLAELEERRLEEVVLAEGAKLKATQKFTQGLLVSLGFQNKAVEYSKEKYTQSLKDVENSIDDTKTALEEYLDTLLTPADIAAPEVPTIPGVGGDGGGGGGAAAINEELAQTLENLRQKEREMVFMNQILGDSYDATGSAVQTYTSAIQELISAGLEPGDKQLDEVIGKLELATLAFDKEKAATEAVNRAKEEMIRLNEQLRQSELDITHTIEDDIAEVLESIDKLGDVELPEFEPIEIGMNTEQLLASLDVIAMSTSSMLNSIGNMWEAEKQREIDAAEGNQRKIDQINKAYGKKQKALNLALAIINTAVGVTKALEQEGPLGIISGIAVAAAGAIQIATIAAQKLQKGGVVPPGYPNDTYPALLSTGETVQPPIPLGRGGRREELVCRIGAQELLFFIREAESASQNY